MTGATGFVGGHLADLAAESGFGVIRAARTSTPEILACDLRDADSIRACLRAAQPNLIVNAAGSPSVVASFENPEASRAINADGAARLLEVAATETPDAHLLLLSSAQVYGEAGEGDLPLAETAPLRPITPYGESKVEMERAAEKHSEAGVRVAVARLFNQLGPGLPPAQAASGFARRIAEAEAEGRESVSLEVANPDAARDFTDVRDTVAAMLEIGRRGLTGTFNICSGTATEIRALIAALGELTDLRLEDEPVPAARPDAEPSVSYGDPSLLREAIDWQPATPLGTSLRDLLTWWRAHLADAP